MSALWTSTSALWLDPFRPLSAANQAQLGEAGLHASPISTLEELEAGLSAPHQGRRAVVLGLGTDIALLHETMTLVNQMDHAVAVVCRTERRQLELAVQALQTGACHVLAADDWSAAAWQAAIQRAAVAALPANENTPLSPASKQAPESAVRSVVYVDPVSRNLLALAQRVAQAQVAVLIEGPTGSGKTSLLEQIAARLHWGVHAVTGHGRLELNDLLGQYMLVDGGAMKWIDGPLTLAVRLGHVLLLNEIDAIDPAELIGLNEVVEGKPLTIPQTGAMITPHPKFRLVATGNSRGGGDQSGLYQGVLRQNLAFLDRFRLLEVGYPEPEDEMQLQLQIRAANRG